MDRTPTGPRVNRAGLYLFATALAADLIFTAAGVGGWRLLSKPLIVAGLAFYFINNAAAKSNEGRLILFALIFSWLGDVLLLFENKSPQFFLGGLSAFLIAHIFYGLFFTGIFKTMRLRLHRPFLMGVLVYYTGLMLLLWPGLGAFKFPVLLYGGVISVMMLLALHTVLVRGGAARLLMPGAVLFVLSDSILAINRFLQPVPLAGIFIMLTYGVAQLLITQGAIVYLKQIELHKRVAATP